MIKKQVSLVSLAVAELLVMSLWFSASAVVPQLTAEWSLSGNQQAWLTMSVQLGFVAGAIISALLNIPDRISSYKLISFSAAAAALTTWIVAGVGSTYSSTVLLRFCTGIFLAGVYPPGMKLMASWCKRDRGLWIGILVGALTFGSALPHLLNALLVSEQSGMPAWRSVLMTTSVLALAGSLLCVFVVRDGPLLSVRAPFDWKYIKHALTDRPTRLANMGYFGHMWELYAMWTWVPTLIIISYSDAELSLRAARIVGFSVVAVGALGSVVGGYYADRIGRSTVTIYSLVVSGSCCLVAGFLVGSPILLTVVALIWGFAVVADSAQFSTAVSELADSRYVGTALTIQTSIGFLLTIITIRGVPYLAQKVGWSIALIPLVIGPIVGAISMIRLRRLPEARKMASGHR